MPPDVSSIRVRIGRRRLVTSASPIPGMIRPIATRLCSIDMNSLRSTALKAQVSTTCWPLVLTTRAFWPRRRRSALPWRAFISIMLASSGFGDPILPLPRASFRGAALPRGRNPYSRGPCLWIPGLSPFRREQDSRLTVRRIRDAPGPSRNDIPGNNAVPALSPAGRRLDRGAVPAAGHQAILEIGVLAQRRDQEIGGDDQRQHH